MEIKMIAVDEDEKSLKNVQRICEGFEDVADVLTFTSPIQALEHIKENSKQAALLLTEIEMEEMNGIELADSVRAVNADMKTVFLTASPQYALRAFDVDAIGYLLKPTDTASLRHQLDKVVRYSQGGQKPRVFIRTFGYFDVFVDGVAVRFSSAKAKELLALLVDRRGGVVTMAQAIENLWPERINDESVRSLYRNVLQSLREILASAGISEIFINTRNSRSVNPTKFECDYYQLADGKPRGITSFHGEYMTDYPWGAATLEVINRTLEKPIVSE